MITELVLVFLSLKTKVPKLSFNKPLANVRPEHKITLEIFKSKAIVTLNSLEKLGEVLN